MKKILISPLNWGLGHATRLVPIIKKCIELNCKIILAANGNAFFFLKKYFPDIQIIKLPNLEIKYSKNEKFFALKLLAQMPKFLWYLLKLKIILPKIISQNDIKIIISDNHFGLQSGKTYNIYITHQLNIKSGTNKKIVDKLLSKLHYKFYKKYNEIWIPDFKNFPNLSGDLSHIKNLKKSFSHIGYLSRFQTITNQSKECEKYKILVIISGVEPQRTILFNQILNQLSKQNEKAAIISGQPQRSKIIKQKNITIYPHLEDDKFFCLMKNSEIIISRAGYSTIMDLVEAEKTAILIPTPKQTEQEYLAKYLEKHQIFISFAQKDFDLTKAVELFLQKKDILEKNLINLKKASQFYRNLLTNKLTQLKKILDEQ